MPQAQLPIILDKLISLTSERESYALKSALEKTLRAIANISNTAVYSAGDIIRAKHNHINSKQHFSDCGATPIDIVDRLFHCLETAKVASILLDENKKLTLFPLLCSKQNPIAVIKVEETIEPPHDDLTVKILSIYHNFLSLMHDNERDTLTGLLNRKTFDSKINIITSDIQSTSPNQDNSNFTYLAIFDLDHFKRINDMYGHLIGDEVLLLFSQQMGKNFRDKDLLFRFGGEEFVGIFQCPHDDTMLHIIDRFRTSIADFQFPQVGKITISCGFRKIHPFDLSSQMIDRADTALYHAKKHGRNAVYQHEQLVALGLLAEPKSNSGDIELF